MCSEVCLRPDDQHANFKSGYNEAVDVWSVGCLAGTLLTNAFLFPRDRSSHSHKSAPDDTADLGVSFNLKFLDTSEDWQGASRKCKSFIRACAMVNDSQRLTVAQALQHPWVAHPSYVAEMHAEYARAIADWTPRTSFKDVIEYLKPPLPTTEALEIGYEARLHDEVRSHHFSSSAVPVPSQFRTFNASVGASKLHQVRLSPIESRNTRPHRPKIPLRVPTFKAESSRLANAETNKGHEDEEMSYLSIQNYAPPVIYSASATTTRDGLLQSRWDMVLAESMDLDTQTITRNDTLPREMFRA
jgi:serine/threonine protein kinase